MRKIKKVVVSGSRGLLKKPELQDLQLGIVMQAYNIDMVRSRIARRQWFA